MPSPGTDSGTVTLTKSARSVTLTKPGVDHGAMRVNLNWSSTAPRKRGFLAKLAGVGGGVDLDLGCLYELADGSKGVIQALGNSFGALDRPPFVALDADDRTGATTGGENLHINLERPEVFRRILIFAMIYEGAPNWATLDGKVTMYPSAGPRVEVCLDSPVDGARICAVALLTSTGQELSVRREVDYITGNQADLDRAYGWGMKWAAGSK
ncbi:tellurium resistance protein [Nocardia sp. 2]|uniref:Tellurium resistance protein n=2 Tax=Nocardia acididurans TaxID=2802282 RepID=A0ABS1MHZ2_9NOCA|nr:tellurium resistance protein [Nocardia acididurans]MBL1080283.1 tellurium resistance protein [Nocardia acididurans]